MTVTDAMGYVAASLVLATFCTKRMVSLRALAISSNVAFITYGLAAQLWPIVILHVIMLPLNVIRLRDALASQGPPSCAGSGATVEDQLTLADIPRILDGLRPRSPLPASSATVNREQPARLAVEAASRPRPGAETR